MIGIILHAIFGAMICFLIINFTRVGIARKRAGKPVSVVDLVAMVAMITFAGWMLFTWIKFDVAYLDAWGAFSMDLILFVPLGTMCVSLVTTIVQRRRHKPIFCMDARQDIIEMLEARKNLPLHDLGRKAWHLALFVVMAIAFFQGYYWMHDFVSSMQDPPVTYVDAVQLFWGSFGGIPVLFDAEYLGTASFIICIVFYLQFYVYSIIEFTRFSSRFDFPFMSAIVKGIRKSEAHEFASYLYLAAGFLFASVLIPSLGLLALFSISCFGDTMAAQVGMRVGKHKLSFNTHKSWEGLIAGAVASFLSAALFVGWWWSLVAVVVYVVADALTPSKIPMSDNLAFPLISTCAFLLFSLAGIPYSPLIPVPRL